LKKLIADPSLAIFAQDGTILISAIWSKWIKNPGWFGISEATGRICVALANYQLNQE